MLVPILIDKVGELSGLDLSGLAAQLSAQDDGEGKASGKKKQGKKGKKSKSAAAAV